MVLGWLVATQVGVIQASRDFLVAWLASFVFVVLVPPKPGGRLFRTLWRSVAVAFLTCGAVVSMRAVTGDHSGAAEDVLYELADIVLLCSWTPLLIAFVYLAGARAAAGRTRPFAEPKIARSAQRVRRGWNERFSVTIWWALSAPVVAWLPLALVLQFLKYGYDWALPKPLEDRVVVTTLFGVGALVSLLGMVGLLPGTGRFDFTGVGDRQVGRVPDSEMPIREPPIREPSE
jgi:hypothetical protein